VQEKDCFAKWQTGLQTFLDGGNLWLNSMRVDWGIDRRGVLGGAVFLLMVSWIIPD
jgi:hypothetical protein